MTLLDISKIWRIGVSYQFVTDYSLNFSHRCSLFGVDGRRGFSLSWRNIQTVEEIPWRRSWLASRTRAAKVRSRIKESLEIKTEITPKYQWFSRRRAFFVCSTKWHKLYCMFSNKKCEKWRGGQSRELIRFPMLSIPRTVYLGCWKISYRSEKTFQSVFQRFHRDSRSEIRPKKPHSCHLSNKRHTRTDFGRRKGSSFDFDQQRILKNKTPSKKEIPGANSQIS